MTCTHTHKCPLMATHSDTHAKSAYTNLSVQLAIEINFTRNSHVISCDMPVSFSSGILQFEISTSI